jgi:hypothetical protein
LGVLGKHDVRRREPGVYVWSVKYNQLLIQITEGRVASAFHDLTARIPPPFVLCLASNTSHLVRSPSIAGEGVSRW